MFTFFMLTIVSVHYLVLLCCFYNFVCLKYTSVMFKIVLQFWYLNWLLLWLVCLYLWCLYLCWSELMYSLPLGIKQFTSLTLLRPIIANEQWHSQKFVAIGVVRLGLSMKGSLGVWPRNYLNHLCILFLTDFFYHCLFLNFRYPGCSLKIYWTFTVFSIF